MELGDYPPTDQSNQRRAAAAAPPPPGRFSRRPLSIDFFSFSACYCCQFTLHRWSGGGVARGAQEQEEEDHQHLICAITRVEWNKKGQSRRGVGPEEKEAPHCPIGNAVIRFFLRPSSDFSLRLGPFSRALRWNISLLAFVPLLLVAGRRVRRCRCLQAGGCSLNRLINVSIVKSGRAINALPPATSS